MNVGIGFNIDHRIKARGRVIGELLTDIGAYMHQTAQRGTEFSRQMKWMGHGYAGLTCGVERRAR